MTVKRASARISSRPGAPSRSGITPPDKSSNRAPAGGSKRLAAAPSKSGIAKAKPHEEELPRGILAEPEEELAPAAPLKKDSATMRRAHPSSRSLKAASSNSKISNRSGGLNTSRDREKERDRDGKNSRRGGEEKTSIRGNAAPNNNMMIIGGVVGGLALILLIVAMSGGSKKHGAKAGAEKQEMVVIPGDPDSLVRQGRAYEAAGERLKAAQAYNDAADIYEKQGRSETAQQWSMKAYDIRKFTTLNRGH